MSRTGLQVLPRRKMARRKPRRQMQDGRAARLGTYRRDRSLPGPRRIRFISWSLLLLTAFLYGASFTFLPPSFVAPLLVPILIMAGFVIWALPAAKPSSRILEFLFFGFFVALVCWPNYLAIALPGLPWITLARVFCIPAAIVLLYNISVSRGFTGEISQVVNEFNLPVKMFLAFVGIQFLSVFFSRDPFDSFQKFVIDQFYWTSSFFIAIYVFRKPGRISLWVAVFLLMAMLLSAIGFWEWRLQHVPWVGHIPGFLKIDDESVLRTLAGASRAGTGIYRVQSTYGTSLGFAEFLALSTPFWLYCALESRALWLRAMCAAAVPILFVSILNTNARLGMVGFFLSLLLYVGLWAVQRWRTDQKSIIGPALTVGYPVLAAGFLAATMFVGRLHTIVWGGSNTNPSTEARIEQVHAGVPMILHWPLGYGVGQGAQVLGYTNGDGTLTIDSYYLNIGLEYGIIGFVIYFGLFALTAGYGVREGVRATGESKLLIPLAIALCVFLVTKSVYAQEPNHPIAFMMLGAVCALAYRNRRRLGSAEPPVPALEPDSR